MNPLREVRPSVTIRERVAKTRRIVIKVGTNVVMRDDGRLALSQLYGIAEAVARLRQQGRDVLDGFFRGGWTWHGADWPRDAAN